MGFPVSCLQVQVIRGNQVCREDIAVRGHGWRGRRNGLDPSPNTHINFILKNTDKWLPPANQVTHSISVQEWGLGKGPAVFGESPSQKHRNGEEVSPSDNLPARNLRAISLSPIPTSDRKQDLSSSLHLLLLYNYGFTVSAGWQQGSDCPPIASPAQCNQGVFWKWKTDRVTYMLKILHRALIAQSCLTLCDPVVCSLPASSVHGISQARILEWIAISFSRESFQPRDQTHVSCVSCIAGGFFTLSVIRKVVFYSQQMFKHFVFKD